MPFISDEEYKELIDRNVLLYCLEAAGVGDWEGYGPSQEAYQLIRGET